VDGQTLDRLLDYSARSFGDRIAAAEPGARDISYAELDQLAGKISGFLQSRGVTRGDRVGIQLPKSIAALAAIFGVLRVGAAYVPVDSTAPRPRNAFIFSDCAVKFVFLRSQDLAGPDSPYAAPVALDVVDPSLSGCVLAQGPAGVSPGVDVPANLAYILYTSGSTGLPKGVMLTHGNALAFINWCSTTFQPDERDHFSSHAPFHFDLSILDIYLSIKHGARLVLISEDVGRNPRELASLIAKERISVWYSTPSILRLLLEVKEIERFDHSSLRIVLYAGEVFPVKHLHRLMTIWPKPRYYNLYGPTETNVCTYFALPESISPQHSSGVPIGKVCSGDSAIVMDPDNRQVCAGDEGELFIAGPSVTCGYWNLPERNSSAFFEDANGVRWYKTGDVVREDAQGNYVYVSRRDRMIKRRGYRVELGEIEAALYRHASITEAAVVALPDSANDVRVTAFINWNGHEPPSIIALKRFCMENLPAYMIPDRFSVQASLPKTSTQKIDYQRLKELA
jgi:amino acid adenylation domain-containing protein